MLNYPKTILPRITPKFSLLLAFQGVGVFAEGEGAGSKKRERGRPKVLN